MGTNLTGIDNATYFKDIDQIRSEGRFLQTPIFLSEFGMWRNGVGARDTARMVSAVYQAMEISDGAQARKTRYADFYSPLVSGTEWHWDFYYDKHHEYMNQNSSKLLTEKDAWNNEDFSVVGNYGTSFNMDYHVIQRSYPRRAQGHIMSYYYNTLGLDSWNNAFMWGAIRPSESSGSHFANRRFAILTWRGRHSDAPTEIFLPPHFASSETLLVTEARIYNKDVPSSAQNEPNEAILVPDPNREEGSGNLLLVWDDVDAEEREDSSLHYALAVDAAGITLSDEYLVSLQAAMNQRVLRESKSPVYLTGKMTYAGYPSE
jgi:endoglycosylceramidase